MDGVRSYVNIVPWQLWCSWNTCIAHGNDSYRSHWLLTGYIDTSRIGGNACRLKYIFWYIYNISSRNSNPNYEQCSLRIFIYTEADLTGDYFIHKDLKQMKVFRFVYGRCLHVYSNQSVKILVCKQTIMWTQSKANFLLQTSKQI